MNGVRADLENRISVARMKLDRAGRKDRELQAANTLLDDLSARQIRLIDRHAALEDEIATIDDAMLSTKARHLEMSRKQALGLEFPTLRTVSGHQYEQAKIMEVTDVGIQIRHATGTARLSFHDLSEAQRHQFGLDEGLAVAAITTEANQRRSYEDQIDAQLAEQSARQSDYSATPSPVYRPMIKPISAFDRFVSLGSNSTRQGRVVARYNPSHRSTYRYYYYYIPRTSSPQTATP